MVASVISPLLIIGGYFSAKLQFGADSVEDHHYASNALLADIIMNHKTVISFGEKNINFLVERYSNFLLMPYKNAVKSAHITGLLFGFG